MAESYQISETGRTKATPDLYNNLVRDTHRLLAVNSGAKTIAVGAISIDAPTATVIVVSAETGTEDDLATINGGAAGDIIALMAASGHKITLVGTGNIAADKMPVPDTSHLLLRYDGMSWRLLGGAGGSAKLARAGTLFVAGGYMPVADKQAYLSMIGGNISQAAWLAMLDGDTVTAVDSGVVRNAYPTFIFDAGAKIALDQIHIIANYVVTLFDVWVSDTGDFAGEEVQVVTGYAGPVINDIYIPISPPAVARYWKVRGYYNDLATWQPRELNLRYQATLLFGGLPWGGKIELLDSAGIVLETQKYDNSVYQQVLLQCVTDAASVATIKIYYPSDLTTPKITATAADFGGLNNGDVFVIEY